MWLHLAIYLTSFLVIWFGSGVMIQGVERISRSLRLSSFLVSFFILGFFTSLSEFFVGIIAIIDKDPEIFVGNLIGASIVLFILIIPLLVLLGKEVKISSDFRGFNLPVSLLVVSMPAALALDGKIDQTDALICLLVYVVLVLSLQLKSTFLEKIITVNTASVKVFRELLKVVVGIFLIILVSHLVVRETEYFAQLLSVSPFVISLLVISLGTNLPELSLVFRALVSHKYQVAFGDFVGSATFNTFLLGVLAFFNRSLIVLSNSYTVSLTFLIFGLVAFYVFARTKNSLNRREGLFLLLLYISFVLTEVF